MRAFIKILCRYLLVLLVMVIAGCALLFVAGLDFPGAPLQKRIDYSIQQSVPIFENENLYPRLLSRTLDTTILDNFTDILMLSTSKLTNTATNPLSIFTNPRPAGGDELVQQLAALADGEPVAGVYYRYWQGFRIFLRPLLTVLDYGSIRELLRFLVWFVFAATTLNVYRHGGLKLALPFALSMSLMELGIVSTSLQFSGCFLLTLFAMLLLPRWQQRASLSPSPFGSFPMFFFIVGGLTQYFDFYTVPCISLGMPLLYAVGLASQEQAPGRSPREPWLRMLACAIAWLCAYLGMWLMRQAVVSLFVRVNAFQIAFQSVASRMQMDPTTALAHYTPLDALQAVLRALLTRAHLATLACAGLGYLVLLYQKARKRQLVKPNVLYAAVMLLPVVWAMVACQPTAIHIFFQYRLAVVALFGGFCFAASAIRS